MNETERAEAAPAKFLNICDLLGNRAYAKVTSVPEQSEGNERGRARDAALTKFWAWQSSPYEALRHRY